MPSNVWELDTLIHKVNLYARGHRFLLVVSCRSILNPTIIQPTVLHPRRYSILVEGLT